MHETRRANSPEFGAAIDARNALESQRRALHDKMVEDTVQMQWPGAFTDSHFNHPNMEGWYRTQDANQGSTRIAEELQPQRYQKMRDLGEKSTPEQIAAAKQASSEASGARFAVDNRVHAMLDDMRVA